MWPVAIYVVTLKLQKDKFFTHAIATLAQFKRCVQELQVIIELHDFILYSMVQLPPPPLPPPPVPGESPGLEN